MTGSNRIMGIGALIAAVGIALGAFGTHALQAVLDARGQTWWHTAVEYQMWNAVGLVALGAVSDRRLGLPALLIAAGAILFPATLYLMALTGARWLGMITPIGGALMIAGWLFAAWRLLRI